MFLLLSHSPHVPPVVTLSSCSSCCHTLLMFLLLSHSPYVPPVVTLSLCSSCCHTLLMFLLLSHSPHVPPVVTLSLICSTCLTYLSSYSLVCLQPHPCTLPFPPTLIPALSPSLPPSSLHSPLPSHPHPCTPVPSPHAPLSPSLSHPYSPLPPVVRCIKPNDVKSSDMFGRDKVLQQMRYTGVLEAIRIRKEVSTGASSG